MGIQLMAQVDTNLAKIAGKDAPFVTALALSRTAIGARDKVRAGLPKRFTLRNSWTRGGIQARTATKANLMAQVLAPGYMAIQETGGVRRPDRTRMLAAPVEAKSSSLIPRNRKPGGLGDRGFLINFKDGRAGIFERFGRKKGQIRLLWTLSPTQDYQERFEFEDQVTTHVKTQFAQDFATEFARVMSGK